MKSLPLVSVLGGTLLCGLAAGARGVSESAVWFKPAADVEAAFAKGTPLVERDNYKVHASRRDAAGQAEVHAFDTDIVHVLSGSATFVTGGRLMKGRETAPEETRGDGIEGGESREIRAGDVIIVPAGIPHWFKAVPAPMTYYVVKVRRDE